MRFSELTPTAKNHAYQQYQNDMGDELNRDSIVPMEEYGALADYDRLDFDPNGNAKP